MSTQSVFEHLKIWFYILTYVTPNILIYIDMNFSGKSPFPEFQGHQTCKLHFWGPFVSHRSRPPSDSITRATVVTSTLSGLQCVFWVRFQALQLLSSSGVAVCFAEPVVTTTFARHLQTSSSELLVVFFGIVSVCFNIGLEDVLRVISNSST